MSTWTKEQIFRRIANGEDPSELGRRGGHNAHKIRDVFVNKGPGVYVKTASHGWHGVTDRERALLFKKAAGVKQHAPAAEQLVLAI